MHPFRVVRRLLSRAHEDWQDAVEGLFSQPHPRRPVGPRPLRVMRLERRRVLSADFSLTATGLVLSGFDDAGGDTLTVQQEGDAYQFTSASGWEQHEPGQMPEGVTIDGDTLSVDRGVLEGLEDGLTIQGSLGHQLDVRLGDADFSSLSGPVTLAGATAVGQDQPFALFTAPTEGFQLIVAPGGTVLSSLNVSGDLNIVSVGGSITDSPGSEILISGNATFVSRAASPAGDFNGDGLVDQTDYTEHWAKNYGMTSGATKYQGDANGDGRVDAADYTLWRDTVGQTGQGGIELANQAGDRLVIGGVATFDAAEPEGTHDIFVGIGGVAEFGSVNAYGANVIIHEDATAGDSGPTTVLGNIEAYTLQVESGGTITDTPTAQIIVNGDASFAVTDAAMIADGPLVQAIVLADGSGPNRLEVGGVATFIVEYPTTQVSGFGGPKGIDVGVATTGSAAGTTFNAGSLRFYAAGGTVRIAEDSAMVLAGWGAVEGPVAAITTAPTASVAHTLQLQSVGGISDDADAVVLVTGVAEGGSLVYDPSASASFYASQSIVLADGGASNVLLIDGLASFIVGPNLADIHVGVTSAGVAAESTFNAGSLRFNSIVATIRIAEDSSTVLAGWTTAPSVFPSSVPGVVRARVLEITSAGSITDESDFNFTVTGEHATFVAKNEIVLADGGTIANSIAISNLATFLSTDGGDVSLGVTASGTQAPAGFNAGSIRFVSVGGDVRIAADSGTLLANWASGSITPLIPIPTPTASVAGNLELWSAGPIADDANARVDVEGQATFVGRGIVLADDPSGDGPPTTNSLTVGGVATFVVGNGSTVQVGATTAGVASPALFLAGGLRFSAPNGTVRIVEDDGTHFVDWMTVPPSPLIATPPMATTALNLQLYSAGSITDAADAVVFATGWNGANRVYNADASATFVAAESITLADGGADNKLMVDGVATFVSTAASGQSIDVGVTPTGGMADAEFIAGGVRFWAPDGSVRLVEDAAVNFKGATYSENRGTVIGSWPFGPASPIVPSMVTLNRARSLEIVSQGTISDAAGAVTNISADAGFRVIEGLIPADGGHAINLANEISGDSLIVGGTSTFVVEGTGAIDIGVTPQGAPAPALFTAGSVRFYAEGGAVRIAEDGPMNLDAWNSLTVGLIRPDSSMNRSVAGSLHLYSAGSISDAATAVVQVNGAATLVAAQDIVLVDGGDDSNQMLVDGLATFAVGYGRTLNVGVTPAGAQGPGVFRAGSLRFSALNGVAKIAEDDTTLLAGWQMGSTSPLLGLVPPMATEAKTIEIYSSSITDAADAVVIATGRDDAGVRVYDPTASATLVASGAITLADAAAGNKLIVDGGATFVSIFGAPINVGATGTGAMAVAQFVAGSIRFSAPGGAVRIVEDPLATFKEALYAETPGTVLAGWAAGTVSPLVPDSVNRSAAGSLELVSNGPITDAANAVVEVTGAAGFRVIGTAIPNDGTVSIRLADAGGDNRLVVGGAATFVVEGLRGIDVGVTPTGTPAAAEFTAGSLRFSSLGAVRIAEDNATQLAGWGDLPVGLIRQAGVGSSQAQTLELLSTQSITDASGAQLRVIDDATFIALGAGGETWAIELADSPNDNQLSIGDLATFIVTAENAGIRVGVTAGGTPANAGFTAGRLRFSAPTGDVQIAEDASTTIGGVVNDAMRGTVLAGWTTDAVSPLLVTPAPTMSQANSLQLVSAGPITDANDAIIDVTIDAGFLVTNAAGLGVSDKAITLADNNTPSSINHLTVGGFATFVTLGGGGIDIGVVPASSAAADATFNAGALRFYAPNSQVSIAEDSGTSLAKATTEGVLGLGGPLPASVAGSLGLTSNGVISDETAASVEVTGDASFTVSSIANVGDDRAIVLANHLPAGNNIIVGGRATFTVVQEPTNLTPKGIDVGVTAAGAPAGAVFTAGSLAFIAPGSSVRIAEDNATVLAGVVNQAGELQLLSAGAIGDEAAAKLQLTGNATFVSAQGTMLAEGTDANYLNVGGLATFVVGSNQTLAVGTPATGPEAWAAFNAGSLRFFAPNGTARIAEDSATEFVDWMTVAPSALIAVPPMAIEAKTIEIISAGSITDTPTAVIIATGNSGGVRVYDPTATATFVATNSITLADSGADNKLIVDGMLTLVSTTGAAQQINVGVNGAGAVAAAEFVAGSVRFSAPGGVVKIAEDASAAYKGVTYSETPGTHIAGWTPGTISALIVAPPTRSAAASLEITSAGAITDAADAKVLISGDAKFTVSTIANVAGPAAITLADGDAANELVIGGHANFLVNQVPAGGGAKGIDVGVVSATGVPAAALFTAGTLGFSAQGGMVRLAEDNDTVLGGFSTAQDLELLSAGFVTDTTSVTTDDGVAATSVTLTQTAKLKAGVNGENDVTLGAGAAAFSMGTPQLFNEAQYLAVQAENVSIHADSGVNIRTGDPPLSNLDNYSQFAGTFYLAATGNVTQVTTAAPRALAADKISFASDNGAVLLRLVELTSTGTDPNLQIKSGGSVALSQPLVGGGTVGDKFAGSSIPSPTSPAFTPVIVEADDPLTGERPDMPARPGNPGFEDVLLAGGENSRLSEAVRLPNGDYVVDHLLQDGGQTRTIDDLYSMVVVVTGDANVGDVHDPNTDARRDVDTADARGVAIENGGNAFLSTLASGDLFFTNRNREGGDQLDGIAVQMAGGVFTAIAAGTLRIDTEDPDSLAANLRTTRLVSKTGTVTNVNSDSATEFGPRAILDPSTEEGIAATSGLVRADQNFEQRITMAIGSRGEDNLLVEVEWADTADIRQFSNANVRLPADPNVPTNTVGSTSIPGSRPYADVVQTPVGAIEANVADQSVTGYQYQTLAGSSRVATITHNYDEAFVPNNPAQNRLPTTVRVFNDAAIDLFDQGGARNLNSVSFSIAPRIITLPPSGFFIISTPDLPQRYEPVSVTLPRAEPTQVTQQTTSDDGRAVTVSSAEDVLYGRVDEKGEWIVDIPGESWPKMHEDAEGDFLREIRDKIDEGPYSKGRYVIKVVTPRSEQLLEEWVKGDDAEVATEAAAKPGVVAPGEEAALPAEGAQPAAPVIDGPIGNGPVEAPAMVAPQGTPLGLLELESAPSDARQVAFAAMAAVGVWRRRLNEAGPFTLDADGVAFTRVKRQRRRRGGD